MCNNCNCDNHLSVDEILSLPELQKDEKEVGEEVEFMTYEEVMEEIRGYKLVFMSHPYADDPQRNLKRVDYLAKEYIADSPNTIVLSPLHSFSYFDNDNMREPIMYECYKMIDRAPLCIFFQYDGCMSSGQSDEILYAEECGKEILVIDVSSKTIDDKLGIKWR